MRNVLAPALQLGASKDQRVLLIFCAVTPRVNGMRAICPA